MSELAFMADIFKKTQNHGFVRATLTFVAPIILLATTAQAGVFSTPRFVAPGEFAVGLEPELILTNGAGFGANVRYTHGIADLSNATFIVGTGSGPRKFRVGGNLTFDFFPDVDKQPGIGVAFQALYYRLKDDKGQLELTPIPYIHKAFVTTGGEIEPFIGLPFGWAFSDGSYKTIAYLSLGSTFKSSEKFRYIIELGVAINNYDSYVSGGIVYYH